MTLLGTGDFLSWTRALRREELPQPRREPPPQEGPQAGDLDRAPSPRHPDVTVFGDWHPPAHRGVRAYGIPSDD